MAGGVKELLAQGYASVFARDTRMAQAVNHTLYHLALRGMGYNNGWQLDRSGEGWFVEHVLAPRGPRVCLDIGANVGEYTRLLLGRTSAEVYAFEPLPAAFEQLQQAGRPYAGRLHAYNLAMGDASGEAEISFGDPTTEHASLATEVARIDYVGAGNTRTMTVRVDALDRWAEEVGLERCDFLKIDVEGLEYEVLRGGQATIARLRPWYVQIEWNTHQLMRGHTLLHFADLLSDYDAYQLLPHGLRRIDAMRPEPNTFCYGNFVFALRDAG